MVRLSSFAETRMNRIALFAFALLAAAGAQGQVYKCVDASGKVFYSQNPCPPSMKREAMSKGAIPPAPAPVEGAAVKGGPKTPAEQEQAFRKRQQDQAKAAKDAEQKNSEAQAKEQNCRNARARLAQYEIGGRITQIDEKGERYYMEDSQIEAARARARAEVSQFCG
jgi:type IV secretory pathway VirB10-like protein